MNSLDIILAIFLVIGLIQGLRKGLFVELASLVGLVLGVVGAIYFSDIVADFLASFVSWGEQTLNLASFAITFIGIVILISFIAKLLTKTANLVALGLVNKLMGGLFGVLKTAFFLSILLLLLNSIGKELPFINEEARDDSNLYTPVASLAPMVLPKLLKELNEYVSSEEDEVL